MDQAPVLLGSDARPLFELPLTEMASRRALKVTELRRLGEDLKITCLPES